MKHACKSRPGVFMCKGAKGFECVFDWIAKTSGRFQFVSLLLTKSAESCTVIHITEGLHANKVTGAKVSTLGLPVVSAFIYKIHIKMGQMQSVIQVYTRYLIYKCQSELGHLREGCQISFPPSNMLRRLTSICDAKQRHGREGHS